MIREAAIQSGMQTLRDDGFQKFIGGITTLNEALRVTTLSLDTFDEDECDADRIT
jgi:type II secretory ATPase GspE/PulE/Tfp pilus assembly ATPase PilB-like protein